MLVEWSRARKVITCEGLTQQADATSIKLSIFTEGNRDFGVSSIISMTGFVGKSKSSICWLSKWVSVRLRICWWLILPQQRKITCTDPKKQVIIFAETTALFFTGSQSFSHAFAIIIILDSKLCHVFQNFEKKTSKNRSTYMKIQIHQWNQYSSI